MKVKPIIQDVLDAYFLPRGFTKNGSVFVRKKGEILQGVSSRLDCGTHYISAACVPILALSECVHDAKELKKGIWTEIYTMADGYGYAQDEEIVREGIGFLMEQFDRCLTTRLDDIDTLEKCVAFTYSGKVEKLPPPLYGYSYQILQPMSVPLLMKAYRDRSFDDADHVIREWYQNRESWRYDYFCESKRYWESTIDEKKQEVEQLKQYTKLHPDDYMAEIKLKAKIGLLEEPTFIPGPKYEENHIKDFPLFFEKKESGDLDWVSQQFPEYESFAGDLLKKIKLQA